MGVVRVASTCAAALAVGGCAVVAVGMARAGSDAQGTGVRRPAAAAPASTSVPALRSTPAAPGSGSASHTVARRVPRRPAPASTIRPTIRPVTTHATHRTPVARRTTPAPRPTTTTTTHAAPAAPVRTSHSRPAAPPRVRRTPHPSHHGNRLLLSYGTGSATRVITVTAGSTGSTTAYLQAWRKASGGGWWRVGQRITAHLGTQGMTRYPSETKSATPMGSFTLTRAFGRSSDPGTALPYLHTSPADWWISQSGPLYNTLQHCSSNCGFNQGSPNEHLYYETPFYRYAVVIDYNTRNAGTVHQGAGSGFFLHVTDGAPTAGCVAIPETNLVSIMRWLTPGTHPRILIGVD